MAFENKGKCVTRKAAADLSAYQYRFVSIDSNGRVNLTGDGAEADGVLQDNSAAAIDRGCEVMIGIGDTKVVAGGAFSAGQDLSSDASGRAVDGSTGDAVMGVALEAATLAGDVVAMQFKPKAGTTTS